jgi:hypothetical protein
LVAQPLDQVVGAAFLRRLQRRTLVVSNPVQVGAAIEEIIRSLPVFATTRTPKSIGDLIGRGLWFAGAVGFHTIQKSKRSGLPDRRPCSALEQPASGTPWRENDGVRHRCAAGTGRKRGVG